MKSTDLLVNQVKTVKDPAEAIPVLAEMFLRLNEKMDVDAEENKKDHALILRTLNGDPEDASYAEKAIHSRLRSVEGSVSQLKNDVNNHEILLRGNSTNSEECGLVDNVQTAMRLTRAAHRIAWIVIGVIIPMVVVMLIKLLP